TTQASSSPTRPRRSSAPALRCVISGSRGRRSRTLHPPHWKDPARMSISTRSAPYSGSHSRDHFAAALEAFVAIVGRDLLVTGREAFSFLVQPLVQPLFFLFVFGKVLPGIGVATAEFSVLLLPGIVAFTAFVTPLQSIATDLGRDLGFTREIDDRLLA